MRLLSISVLACAAASALAFLPRPSLAAEGGEEPTLGSFQSWGQGFLEAGALRIVATSSELGDVDVVCDAYDYEPSPGSLYLPSTPFGEALLLTDDPEGGDYLFVSSTTPNVSLSGSELGNEFAGSVDGISLSIGQDPILNQGGTKITREPSGPDRRRIRITEQGDVEYRQFVSVAIYVGNFVMPGPVPYGKPITTTGNNYEPVATDGTRVYVDAAHEDENPANLEPDFNPVSPGEYPAKPDGNGGTTMTDEPNALDTQAIADDVKWPVTYIHYIFHYTTYVIRDGTIESKLEWSYVETRFHPFSSNDLPNGDYGKPGIMPPPPGSLGEPKKTETDVMDAHHQEAYDRYVAGDYTGAEVPGGAAGH